MNLKKILSELDPSITDMLPHGALQEIAEEMGKHYLSISRMLDGEIGSKENVKKATELAIQKMLSKAEENKENAETLISSLEGLIDIPMSAQA